MIQDGGFCGARRARLVVDRNRVQKLRPCRGVQTARSFLDHAQPKMDVPEELPFGRRRERRPFAELRRSSDIVKERRSQKEIRAQAWVQLCDLTCHRRDTDSVFQEAACIRVVGIGCCGKHAQTSTEVRVVEEPRDHRSQACMRDFAPEKVEEALELIRIASECGCESGWVCVWCGLERAHLDLQPVAEALHASEHSDRVAFAEAPVEELHVVPDPRVDPSALIDELERKVRRTVSRSESPLAGNRVDPFDDTLLRQLRNRAHEC